MCLRMQCCQRTLLPCPNCFSSSDRLIASACSRTKTRQRAQLKARQPRGDASNQQAAASDSKRPPRRNRDRRDPQARAERAPSRRSTRRRCRTSTRWLPAGRWCTSARTGATCSRAMHSTWPPAPRWRIRAWTSCAATRWRRSRREHMIRFAPAASEIHGDGIHRRRLRVLPRCCTRTSPPTTRPASRWITCSGRARRPGHAVRTEKAIVGMVRGRSQERVHRGQGRHRPETRDLRQSGQARFQPGPGSGRRRHADHRRPATARVLGGFATPDQLLQWLGERGGPLRRRSFRRLTRSAFRECGGRRWYNRLSCRHSRSTA